MIKFWKTGAGVILVTAAMMAPASAAEPVRTDAAEPVRTASVAAPAIDVVHRTKPSDGPIAQRPPESNGWGMLAAGLCIGLLIVTRRRRG